MKILVIEDDASISELLCMNLGVAGYDAFPVYDGLQAAQDISGGMFSRRADVSARDETGEVAEAFNSMAERIERQVEELSSESERRRQLLGSLTHEMKTPMTSIMGYADSLLHVNLSQTQKESALRHIYDECGRLGRVNSKLMSLIGLYDNDSITMEETSIEEVFESVVELEEKNLKSRKMILKYICQMDKRFLDKDLMISLLVNLVDNAAKAGEEGACIHMTARENIIAVRDNGCGIPEEEIPRVTEALYMVDKARSRKAGGNGLGLALCSRIAELHGADLRIDRGRTGNPQSRGNGRTDRHRRGKRGTVRGRTEQARAGRTGAGWTGTGAGGQCGRTGAGAGEVSDGDSGWKYRAQGGCGI